MNNDTKMSSGDTTRFDDSNDDTIWDPRADMDDDGDVDASDETLYDNKYSDWSGAGPPVDPRQAFSDKGNPFMFQGIPHFALDTSSSATEGKLMLNHHRARFADPVTGRWTTRDAARYIDGSNMFEYAKSKPSTAADPRGCWIIMLGGAGGIGDTQSLALLDYLSSIEAGEYGAARPCTSTNVPGAPEQVFITSPTGNSWILDPNWNGARQRLMDETKVYHGYRNSIEARRQGGECVCPEFLSIVGFSDGASAIAFWLNTGATFATPNDTALVGLVDMVRHSDNHCPNILTSAMLPVQTQTSGSSPPLCCSRD